MARTRAVVQDPVSVPEAITNVVINEGVCRIYTDLIRGHMDRAATTARDVVDLTSAGYLRDELERRGVPDDRLDALFALIGQ